MPRKRSSEREVEFGAWMRSTRLAAGLPLRELARRCGVTPGYLSRVESGEAHAIPSETLLLVVAPLLGVDADEVMARAGRIPADILSWLSDAGRLRMMRSVMRGEACVNPIHDRPVADTCDVDKTTDVTCDGHPDGPQ